MRREDRETDALAGQYVERLIVHGRFRQPHAFGLAPEPAPEVGDAPAYLGHLVAAGGERSEEHTSELQSPCNLVCRLLLEKKKKRDSTRAACLAKNFAD